MLEVLPIIMIPAGVPVLGAPTLVVVVPPAVPVVSVGAPPVDVVVLAGGGVAV
jgi:hypothetical protein